MSRTPAIKILPCALVAFFAVAECSYAAFPLPGAPWPANDDLGRSLSLADETGPLRNNRFVGIFYFLWHDRSGGPVAPDGGPFDIAKILAHDPDALSKPDSPLWGPPGAMHYWGEPLYGYYRGDDEWVLRRHAHLLADAGVDVVIFDTTNARTYPETYLKLCEVFRDVRSEGGRTPQIAFMVNTRAGETADKIFRELYEPRRYQELWFTWQDKPLLICDPDKASDNVRNFFTLRRAHWPFTMVNTQRAWHWEAAYPQPYGYVDDPNEPEQVNVSVAQNLRISDGKVTSMSSGEARGRSFHRGKRDAAPEAVDHGFNFQEQWGRAFQLDPPFVMITGWNEWIAGRYSRENSPIAFIDQYDQEHSRDVEFAKVGHRDNYYWQMVDNIRRYKGAASLPRPSDRQTIDLLAGFNQWKDVAPTYKDHVGETIPRDHPGAGQLHYRNRSGRNDLIECKAARDDRSIYFYVRAADPLRPGRSMRGLWLLIDVDQSAQTGWEGYDLIVGRDVDAEGNHWLEKNADGWRWSRIARVEVHQKGAELHLAVPRSALGASGGGNLAFDFKWADNLQHPGDLMDFYLNGDVAPEGRFNYRYCDE